MNHAKIDFIFSFFFSAIKKQKKLLQLLEKTDLEINISKEIPEAMPVSPQIEEVIADNANVTSSIIAQGEDRISPTTEPQTEEGNNTILVDRVKSIFKNIWNTVHNFW